MSRRYFGLDRALYGVRGPSFVGPAGRGHDLPEFRTALDSGLCGDYFKAHDAGVRGRRNRPQVARKPADSGSWLGRGAGRTADRSAPGGTDRADRRELARSTIRAIARLIGKSS